MSSWHAKQLERQTPRQKEVNQRGSKKESEKEGSEEEKEVAW